LEDKRRYKERIKSGNVDSLMEVVKKNKDMNGIINIEAREKSIIIEMGEGLRQEK